MILIKKTIFHCSPSLHQTPTNKARSFVQTNHRNCASRLKAAGGQAVLAELVQVLGDCDGLYPSQKHNRDFIFETAIVKHKKKGCCDGIVLMDRGRRLHAHKTWYVLLFETQPAYRDVPTHNATHATHKTYKTIHFLREISLVFIAHYTHCCGLGALCCEFHTRRYGRRTLEGLSQRERAREKRRCTCILTFFRSFSIIL